MEFLVNIHVNWPADGNPAELQRLLLAERGRGAELVRAGILRRIWRVPGRFENWGLWYADDATALHEALASLPFYPFLDIRVIPLADHPTDPDSGGDA